MLCSCFGASILARPLLTVTATGTVLPIPKIAKIKAENRSFLDRWEAEYLFTYVKDRTICLVCGANVAITKEYNIRRHYETKHHDKYKAMDLTQRRQKVEEMKISLVSQQTMFKKVISQSEECCKGEFYCGSRDHKISPALQ